MNFKRYPRKITVLFLAFAMLVSMIPEGNMKVYSSPNPGELIVSITALDAKGAVDSISADIGSADTSASLKAFDNNTQIKIGGTGRTPIVINNTALTGTRSWTPAAGTGSGQIATAPAFQLSFNTQGRTDLKFSCTQKSTENGPDEFRLAYSLDGTDWVIIPNSEVRPVRVSDNSYNALKHTYFQFPLPAAMENNSEVFLRVYFTGRADLGRNGNTSINDIRITSGDYQPYETLQRPDRLIINQVYGSGTLGTGAVSHSFIELYNPTNAEIDLADYSVWYTHGIERGEGFYGGDIEMPISGKLPPSSSYLIVSTEGVNPDARYKIEKWDSAVNFPISDRAFNVRLAYGANNIIEQIGVTNSANIGDCVEQWNGSPFDGISRYTSARRINFSDTWDNSFDFERIDYRITGITNPRLAQVRPRSLDDGVWGEDIFPLKSTQIEPPTTNRPDYIIINQVYGNGDETDTAVSHGFIELYNPTKNAIDLNGYTLHYRRGIEKGEGSYGSWQTLDLSGSLAEGYSLLIVSTVNVNTQARYVINKIDDIWDIPFSNRAFSIKLTDDNGNLVDLVGVTNNMSDGDDAPHYETRAFNGISENASARRVNLADYNENNVDFEQIDFRRTAMNKYRFEQMKPRSTADGPWGLSIRPIYRIPEGRDLAFSNTSGFYDSSFGLMLSTAHSNSIIRYTTDGSEPTTASPIYTIPLNIANRTDTVNPDFISWLAPDVPLGESVSKGNIIRARVFDSTSGKPLSGIHTKTFFVGLGGKYPNLPVISLTTEVNNLFGTTGIYDNPFEKGDEWERPVHFEIIEPDGINHSQDMGVRISNVFSGGNSAGNAQKTFNLYAGSRNDDINPSLNYDLFNGNARDSSGEAITEFDRFSLSPAGNDFEFAMMRDPLLQARANGLNMLYQSYRPAVVFLNGEFWGYYYIRESIDEQFIADKTNIDNISKIGILNFELPKADNNQSDIDTYMEVFDWFEDTTKTGNYDWKTKTGTPMSDDAFEKAKTFLDMENFMDYWAFQMIVANHDWPGNNTTLWRYRTDEYPDNADSLNFKDGRWRYILRDIDFAYELYTDSDPTTWVRRFNDGIFKVLLEDADDSNLQWPVSAQSTLFFRKLMSNDDFKEAFLTRITTIMNTKLNKDTIVSDISILQSLMSPVMAEQTTRWGRPANWEDEVTRFRNVVNARNGNLLGQITTYFGLTSKAMVVSVNNSASGHFIINGVEVKSASSSGQYLTGTTQTITAIPKERHHLISIKVNNDELPIENKTVSFDLTVDNTTVNIEFATTACTHHTCTECDKECKLHNCAPCNINCIQHACGVKGCPNDTCKLHVCTDCSVECNDTDCSTCKTDCLHPNRTANDCKICADNGCGVSGLTPNCSGTCAACIALCSHTYPDDCTAANCENCSYKRTAGSHIECSDCAKCTTCAVLGGRCIETLCLVCENKHATKHGFCDVCYDLGYHLCTNPCPNVFCTTNCDGKCGDCTCDLVCKNICPDATDCIPVCGTPCADNHKCKSHVCTVCDISCNFHNCTTSPCNRPCILHVCNDSRCNRTCARLVCVTPPCDRPGKPTDSNGNEGWEAIGDALIDAKEGDIITIMLNGNPIPSDILANIKNSDADVIIEVNLNVEWVNQGGELHSTLKLINNTTILPSVVFETIKNTDLIIEVVLPNDIEITIDGKTIQGNIGNFDLGIDIIINKSASTINGTNIPANSIVINFAEHGNFGFELSITITAKMLADAGLNGDNLNLFYVDSNGNVMRKGKIKRNINGSVTITIDSASSYILTETNMLATSDNQPKTSKVKVSSNVLTEANETNILPSTILPPNTGDNSKLLFWLWMLMVSVFGLGAVIYLRKFRG